MKKRLETISIVFGALFIIGIILALVLSPLRGSYFNYSNYMDRALVVSGIDKGKIETARAQTNLISETTGLDISKTSNVRKKIASSSAESNKSNNYTSTKQPYDYDVASKSQISMFSEPTKNSVNTNQNVSPVVPNASFIASNNIETKKRHQLQIIHLQQDTFQQQLISLQFKTQKREPEWMLMVTHLLQKAVEMGFQIFRSEMV